jgi:hypothetical protein
VTGCQNGNFQKQQIKQSVCSQFKKFSLCNIDNGNLSSVCLLSLEARKETEKNTSVQNTKETSVENMDI